MDIAPSGVRSKSYLDGARRLRLLEFGHDLDHAHWCTTGHTGFVVDGEVEIEFAAKVIRLKQGDGLSIPAGEDDKHRPRAISEKVRLVFFEEV